MMSVTEKYLQSWIDALELNAEVATYFAAIRVPAAACYCLPATEQIALDEFSKSSTGLRNMVSPNDI
jgi:hypothetical protein